MPILVFLGFSVLDLGPMYATDRQSLSDIDAHRRLMPPTIRAGHNDTDTVIFIRRTMSTVKAESESSAVAKVVEDVT